MCNASALCLPQRNSLILEIDLDCVNFAFWSDVWLQQADDLLDRVQALSAQGEGLYAKGPGLLLFFSKRG